MRISEVVTTPLWIPYKKPYHWAQGVTLGAGVILVEVRTDEGVSGYGESIATPSAEAICTYLSLAAHVCIGRSPFENARLMAEAYHTLFRLQGTCSAPRFAGQVLAGLEMALWDAMGKTVDRPVHELLGGAVRDEVRYFGFPQGATAEELAAEAAGFAEAGCDVIYVKVGRGDDLDTEIVAKVRDAIGPEKRLRLDPNERWQPARAARMIGRLSLYDIDLIEQPTHAESIDALARVRARSPVAIAADQSVFTPHDAFQACCQRAADLIVIGLHETGGLLRFCKVAHIAAAADIDVCIHGLYESGITTAAANQVAAVTPNLDDANQYMNNLLAWDIVKSPDLTPQGGVLPVLDGPGLGFDLDRDAVARAAQAWRDRSGARPTLAGRHRDTPAVDR